MAAALLPTPPIGATGSSTSITDSPYVVLAEMSYPAWRALGISLDTRQSRQSVATNANDTIDAVAHGFVTGDQVAFDTVVTDTAIVADTLYFVRAGGLTDDVFTVSATLAGAAVNLAGSGTANVYRSNFSSQPVSWAALVAADGDIAERWLREISWAYNNPGITPRELYNAEADNAVKLGWRYGALSTGSKLSPYIDYSQFDGVTISTAIIRGFDSLPAIEQARFELIIAIVTANQSRLGEVARRFGVTNGAAVDSPDYNALALVAHNGFDPVNQVVRVS